MRKPRFLKVVLAICAGLPAYAQPNSGADACKDLPTYSQLKAALT